MWISQSSLERIRELEKRLEESVPRAVYTEALTRITELERRVDWQADMLLRRGKTLPLPEKQPEQPTDEPQPIAQVTETVIAQRDAIVAEGRRRGASQREIEEAVRLSTGWDESDIHQAIHGKAS